MKTLTVFTPTYNRAHLLPRLYDSLISQSSHNFIWMIIDDGSTDHTEQLIQKYIDEGKITIVYHYQENHGMVAAHNTAHHLMETELCVCIDSDDWMPSTAVERIIELWGQNGHSNCAGMVGLDAYSDGKIVGTLLPRIKECKFSELYALHKVSGDKKFVHNRKVFNKYLPYPVFKGEKFPVTSYLYLLIEQKHKLLVFNEVFSIIEYQEDGLSKGLIQQYKDNPKAFAFYRTAKMKYALTYSDRFRNAIHFVSSSIFANDYLFLKKSPFKFTTLLALPFGVLLFFYLRFTTSTAINKKLNKT